MRKRNFIILGAVLLFVVVGIFFNADTLACKYVSSQIQRQISMPVQQKFAEAVKNEDLHFIGINGYGLFTPGIDDLPKPKEVIQKIPVRAIKGTSDMFICDAHISAHSEAAVYGATFNKLMLEHVLKLENI